MLFTGMGSCLYYEKVHLGDRILKYLRNVKQRESLELQQLLGTPKPIDAGYTHYQQYQSSYLLGTWEVRLYHRDSGSPAWYYRYQSRLHHRLNEESKMP